MHGWSPVFLFPVNSLNVYITVNATSQLWLHNITVKHSAGRRGSFYCEGVIGCAMCLSQVLTMKMIMFEQRFTVNPGLFQDGSMTVKSHWLLLIRNTSWNREVSVHSSEIRLIDDKDSTSAFLFPELQPDVWDKFKGRTISQNIIFTVQVTSYENKSLKMRN